MKDGSLDDTRYTKSRHDTDGILPPDRNTIRSFTGQRGDCITSLVGTIQIFDLNYQIKVAVVIDILQCTSGPALTLHTGTRSVQGQAERVNCRRIEQVRG